MTCLSKTLFNFAAWSDAKLSKEIARLARNFIEAQNSLAEFDNEHTSKLDTLQRHNQRIEHILEKNNDMIQYVGGNAHEEDVGDDLELLRSREQDLMVASQATQKKIKSMQDQREVLVWTYQAALRRLQETFTKLKRRSSARNDQLIDDDMLSSTTLDAFEEQCAEFDAMLAEGMQEQDFPEENWVRDHLNQEYLDDENLTLQLKMDWADACAAKQALEASSDPAEIQDQIEELTEQVRSLGVQLALRGMPIRDGQWIGELCDPENVPYSSIMRAVSVGSEQDFLRTTGHGLPGLNEGEVPWSSEQRPRYERGLFDGATGIDKPSANHGDDDKVPMTEDQYRAMVSNKIVPRVLKWLDDVEVGNSEERPISDELDASFATLTDPNIEDSLSRVVEAPALPPSQCFDLKTRQQAWKIQLANDRRDVAMMVKRSSPWIELPPGFEEWA